MRTHSLQKRIYSSLAIGLLFGSLMLMAAYGGCVLVVIGLYTLERSWTLWCKRAFAARPARAEPVILPQSATMIDWTDYAHAARNAKQADRMTGLLLETTMLESEVA